MNDKGYLKVASTLMRFRKKAQNASNYLGFHMKTHYMLKTIEDAKPASKYSEIQDGKWTVCNDSRHTKRSLRHKIRAQNTTTYGHDKLCR